MSKNLEIVIICNRIVAPPIDGGANYVFNTALSLSEKGHNITFLNFRSSKHKQSPEMIEKFANIFYDDLEFKEYNYNSIIKSFLQNKSAMIIERFDIKKMTKLLDNINKYPDFFFIEGIHSAEIFDVIKTKFPKSKIILRQANVEHNLLKKKVESITNPILKFIINWQADLMYKYEKEMLPKFDAVTSVSDDDIQTFRKMAPNQKYLKVANSMTNNYIDRSKIKENMILLLGDWTWHPNKAGLDWFLKSVYPLLIEYKINFKINVIGRGLLSDYFSNYHYMKYHGFVEDINLYYHNSKLMIAPLIYGAGTKVKIIESMSNTLPVVTTKYGNEGLNAKENLEIIIADEADQFAKMIVELLRNDDLRIKLSENAYQFAKNNYDKYIVIDRFIEELYKIQD